MEVAQKWEAVGITWADIVEPLCAIHSSSFADYSNFRGFDPLLLGLFEYIDRQ